MGGRAFGPPLCRGCAPATPPSKTIAHRPCARIPAVTLQRPGCRQPNMQSDSLYDGRDKGLVMTGTVYGLIVTIDLGQPPIPNAFSCRPPSTGIAAALHHRHKNVIQRNAGPFETLHLHIPRHKRGQDFLRRGPFKSENRKVAIPLTANDAWKVMWNVLGANDLPPKSWSRYNVSNGP